MEITKDARDRIFAAADQLFEDLGRESFPTVDAVRRQARVNMNDASAGMREWRRQKTAQVAPVAVQVPEAVQQAGNQAVAVLWHAAQELANASLLSAQAGWEAERAELEVMRQELVDAYEAQAREVEQAQARIRDVELELAGAADRAAEGERLIEDMRGALAASDSRAAVAQQRAEEIEHRARELRTELDHAHGNAQEQRQAAEAARKEAGAAREEAAQLRGRIEALEGVVSAEREAHQEQRQAAEDARKEAGAAREEAAQLRGRTEALEGVVSAERQAHHEQRQAAEDARKEFAQLRNQMDVMKAEGQEGTTNTSKGGKSLDVPGHQGAGLDTSRSAFFYLGPFGASTTFTPKAYA